MAIHAEVYDDIVEVIDTNDDCVLDSFEHDGESTSQLIIMMRRRYGALAPKIGDVTDHRGPSDDPPGAGTIDEPYYPDVTVQLTGRDGNAGAIMGAVSRALKRAKVPQKEIDRYRLESMSGDYNHLLQTAMRWVDVG